MPNSTTVVVCLPGSIPTNLLPVAAVAAYANAAGSAGDHIGPAHHFPIRRRRNRQLLQPWQGVAAGGPVRLLHLDAMEEQAGVQAWHRWTVWSQVVRGTQPAQPFWRFVDRHRQDPDRYPLRRARQDYLAQPRVHAMSIHNAAAPRAQQIPTSHLEALQVNCQAYVTLQRMRAVPADAVVTLDGTLLTAAGERLSTVHGYLGLAHAQLHALSGAHQLVALATG